MLTVTNSTFLGNAASPNGGGIANSGGATLTVTSSTFVANSAAFGGGIYNLFGATLIDTIVANSSGGDLAGTFSGSNNLIDDTTISRLSGTGNISAPPLLGALGNYGGATQTIPLLPGSPAIDAGTATGAPGTDQRGMGRVGAPDIGAFESQGFTASIISGNAQQAVVNTPFPRPLVVGIAANNAGEPVQGGVVSFAVSSPPGGASATLSASTAPIDAQGHASITATANGVATPMGGSPYGVVARGPGISSVEFYLGNLPPTITLSPTVLPAGVKGIAYQTTVITASGTGTVAPFTFTVPPGTLPPGLSLASDGTLSGTPTAVGQSAFTVTATDQHGYTGMQQYTVTISAAPLVRIVVTYNGENPAFKGSSTPTVKVGEVAPFIATAVYQDGSTADITAQVTWSGSNSAVALVTNTPPNPNPSGLVKGDVTGLTPGTLTVTATQGALSGQASVTVSPGTATGVAPAPAGRPSGTAGQPVPPPGAPTPAPAPKSR
jgi:hypothetical protein